MTTTTDYEQQAIDFLNQTGTEFKAQFKEFASMPWDKDGQKRNIFTITLSNDSGEYSFDFGSSVAASADMEPKINTIIESDKLTVYAGVKSVNSKAIQSGIIMNLTKAELLNPPSEKIIAWVEELEDQIKSTANDKNKAAYKLFEDGKISRDKRDSMLDGRIENGMCYQVVNNSIKRKIEELTNELVYSKFLQSETREEPTAYDVLTCLTKYNPGTFEDFCGDFGYDEDSRSAEKTYKAVCDEWLNVQRLFTDKEIEALQEIN